MHCAFNVFVSSVGHASMGAMMKLEFFFRQHQGQQTTSRQFLHSISWAFCNLGLAPDLQNFELHYKDEAKMWIPGRSGGRSRAPGAGRAANKAETGHRETFTCFVGLDHGR